MFNRSNCDKQCQLKLLNPRDPETEFGLVWFDSSDRFVSS